MVDLSGEGAGGLVVVGIFGVIFLVDSNSPWVNSFWYSYEYGVSRDDVRTDARPTHCDFLTAPLGIKGCSYKAQVQIWSADGGWLPGGKAPKYGIDTPTGKPIVSYDGGTTWDWSGSTLKPKFVEVYWVKE